MEDYHSKCLFESIPIILFSNQYQVNFAIFRRSIFSGHSNLTEPRIVRKIRRKIKHQYSMPLLMSKNDVVEVVCKFKGRIVPSTDVQTLKNSLGNEVQTTCERCNFSILIKIDPDDSDCYLVSDYE